jgi:hypothetical protein
VRAWLGGQNGKLAHRLPKLHHPPTLLQHHRKPGWGVGGRGLTWRAQVPMQEERASTTGRRHACTCAGHSGAAVCGGCIPTLGCTPTLGRNAGRPVMGGRQ